MILYKEYSRVWQTTYYKTLKDIQAMAHKEGYQYAQIDDKKAIVITPHKILEYHAK